MEIRKQQFARMHNRLLPLAFDHFENVLADPDAPIRDKTMIGKVVLEACKNLDEDSVQKEPHAMTPAELERARQQLLAELAARSKPIIDHEPMPAPDADIFD